MSSTCIRYSLWTERNDYLVEPQNIEDLADKMMKITEHPITDVKLDDRFGIQHAEEKYAALLQSVE